MRRVAAQILLIVTAAMSLAEPATQPEPSLQVERLAFQSVTDSNFDLGGPVSNFAWRHFRPIVPTLPLPMTAAGFAACPNER